MKKISSRSRDLPNMIASREDFETYGALRGGWHDKGRYFYTGALTNTYDRAVLNRDRAHIEYIVWSYSTPIAWWSQRYGWHKVRQTFSVTTGRHQGALYKIPGPRWEPFFDAEIVEYSDHESRLVCKYQRGEHHGPVGFTDDGTMCERHYNLRPAVKRQAEMKESAR